MCLLPLRVQACGPYGYWLLTLTGDPYATALKTRMDTSGTVNGTVSDTVNDALLPFNLANRIVEAINANCRITYDALAVITGASRRTVSREIKMLTQRGVIKRIGSDKTGHWEVVW